MKTINEPSTELTLFVKTALKAWTIHIKRASDFFDSVSDEVLNQEVAPGRNSGTYLLGHLTATHDAMLPILGLGTKLYPDMEKPFISSPDKSGLEFPSVAELRRRWTEVNNKLAEAFAGMEDEDWLTRHTVVSAEDFAKEPHRNKLSVLLSRTSHIGSHLGQLIFLKPRK